jgi:hypothetical protein
LETNNVEGKPRFRLSLGQTLLVATFLILAEKALAVVNGRRTEVQV